MSVAPLTAQEFGCFVAICHKHLEAGPLSQLCQLASLASSGNAGAFSAQYGESLDVCDASEIEAAALDYLAERRDITADHFGPLAYNMVANDGTAFVAPGVQATTQCGLLDTLQELERRAHEWQDAEHRKMERAEQNAAAFDDVGQLRTLSREAIDEKRKAAKCDRIIVAEYRVDESDCQTDYFNGRTARVVVIGFGKGKRESFRQLRKAAGQFPPTSHMGPGKDIYTPRVVMVDDVVSNGAAYWKGSYSHWHHELDDTGRKSFPTEVEALAYIAEKGDPEEIVFDGSKVVRFGWKIEHGSYENRENYSMGGGNYLGTSRYGGWKVTSTTSLWKPECEVFGI